MAGDSVELISYPGRTPAPSGAPAASSHLSPEPAALSVVDGLTERHPEVPDLRWKRDELRDLVRRHGWQPPAPADLLRRISRLAARGELSEPRILVDLLSCLFAYADAADSVDALRRFARSGPDGARVVNELASPASIASLAYELSERWRQLGCRTSAYDKLNEHFRDERTLIARVQALDP